MGFASALRHGGSLMAGLLVLALVGGRPAHAQGPGAEPARAFGEALKTWAAKHRVRRAFIIVRRDGRIVHTTAIGGADPEQPVHLASLSKAITGACVATLVRDGKLGFDTPVAAALKGFIDDYGPPRDPRLARVTVGELLAHRAGFPNGDDDDPASGRNLDRYLLVHGSRQPPKPELLAAVLKAKLAAAPGARYAYGNAAYHVLGAIIEEASGQPYLSYCRGAVLAPLGLRGDFAPAWRVSAAMGAWQMKGEDYLKFLDLFDTRDERLGGDAKAWMADPQGKSVPFDPSAWYGLGVLVRKADRGLDVWHWGSWDYTPEAGEKGTVRTSFVALANRRADGTAWFVHANPRVEEGAPRTQLMDGLDRAYRSINQWD
jgi:CubicO group peptidase (beta-lactamase class C family)